MPVASVLAHLASGMTVAQMLEEWPQLEEADIHQALSYAACAMDEEVVYAPVAATP